MRREYKTVIYDKAAFFSGQLDTPQLEYTLNEQGREGWELVSATPNRQHTRTRGVLLILKKQR